MTVLWLTEIWSSCCVIREMVLSNGKDHTAKFKPANATEVYGNWIYRDPGPLGSCHLSPKDRRLWYQTIVNVWKVAKPPVSDRTQKSSPYLSTPC